MAKSHNTLLWIGAAGIGGLLLYKWWQGKSAAAVAPEAANPVSTLSNPTNIPQSGVIAVPTVQQAQPGQMLQLPSGIDPTMYSVVQKWADTDGRPPVLAMAAANVPAEYAGMYDIISNYWDASVPVGATQQTFWDNLRTKYDPNHQYW